MARNASATKTVRARKSFADVVKIDVALGETQLDAHVAARLEAQSAAETENAQASRLAALQEAFSQLPADDAGHDALAEELAAEELRDELNAPSAPAAPVGPSFRELMLSLDDNDIELAQRTINAAIDERAAFEASKKGDGANIQRTLKKAREGMAISKAPARVLIAAHVDTAFVNRTLHDGSRYNVYAIDKVVDVLRALATDTGELRNAINRAIVKSLFQLKRAGHDFNLELAKGCASDKYNVDLSLRKHLTRHTVAAGTAPTQASSTMQALETLGVVTRSGSSRNPTFQLTQNPIVAELEARMMQAA